MILFSNPLFNSLCFDTLLASIFSFSQPLLQADDLVLQPFVQLPLLRHTLGLDLQLLQLLLGKVLPHQVLADDQPPHVLVKCALGNKSSNPCLDHSCRLLSPHLSELPSCLPASHLSLQPNGQPPQPGVLAHLKESSHPSLDQPRSCLHPLVPLAVKPHPHVLLDHHSARPQFVTPQLLHVGHLPGPEEKLVLAKLVFVGVLDQPGNNILAGAPVVPLGNVLGPAKHAVPHIEVVVGPPARVASCRDPDSLKHSTGSQLLHRSLLVKHEGSLCIVGFDASHVVRVGRVEVVHQKVQGISKLTANRLLVCFLVSSLPC